MTSAPTPAHALPPTSLRALRERIARDLDTLCLPARPWVPAMERDGRRVEDVVVIGGGMAGLALSASLKHLGVRALVLDRAPAGFEGPWSTTARMETLRSPKELTGPALGIPSLTFRAWYEAQFGDEAWAALDKIPTAQWADYLRWYRSVLSLEVRNGQRVVGVHPRADGVVCVEVVDETCDAAARTAAGEGGGSDGAAGDERPRDHAQSGRRYEVLARRLVLATGRDGLGGPWVPEWSRALPRERWVHSSDVWDGERYRGRRVAVIGGGSSAMDAAATALEHGAARVDLLVRRPDLPRVNKSKASGNPGMAHGFWALPDEWKWRFRHYINVQQVPPPRGSTQRVSRHERARFLFGVPVTGVQVAQDGALRLATPKGVLETDDVIFSTGFRTNWSLRPEFAGIAPHVRVWSDRFTPPPGEDDDELAGSPDLGDLFEFQPKTPGACPGLERVHCFNFAGALSQGAGAGDIPQISDGAQRLARGLAARLLAEDAALHFDALTRFSEPELLGDEWAPGEFPGA